MSGDSNIELIEALHQLEKEKGIDKETLLSAIEAALASAYKKNFGSVQNVNIIINEDTGNIDVFAQKQVVEEVTDKRTEISLEEAQALNPNYELEDVVETEITPKAFGRIAAQTAKQVVVQRIREAERSIIYEEYANRENEIVNGIVQRHEMNNVYIDLGKTEAVLPNSEQIPGEPYNQGDRIKAYIVDVKKTTKGPQIVVSRTHPGLLRRLFELEVPEIFEGVVEIKSISREPGSRSKVAVSSRDENVDPVGACVGPKGSRVQAIVSELRGEKIDIVHWDEAPAQYVANALSPAKVVYVDIIGEKTAQVIVPDYQLSLAIGKEGQNARLAAKLTGWKIDIKSESQRNSEAAQKDVEEDVELEGQQGDDSYEEEENS